MFTWVSSRFCGFLPLSINMQVDSAATLPLCLSACVHGALSGVNTFAQCCQDRLQIHRHAEQ